VLYGLSRFCRCIVSPSCVHVCAFVSQNHTPLLIIYIHVAVTLTSTFLVSLLSLWYLTHAQLLLLCTHQTACFRCTCTQGRNASRAKVKRSKSVDVDIPPGVDTGITMRMRGQGAEGDQGYPAGA
jgi:hypothetical protein